MVGLVTITQPFKVLGVHVRNVKGKDKLIAMIEVDGQQQKAYCWASKVVKELAVGDTYKISRGLGGRFIAVKL